MIMKATASLSAKFNLSLFVMAALLLAIFISVNSYLYTSPDYSGGMNESNRQIYILNRIQTLSGQADENVERKEALREIARSVGLLSTSHIWILDGNRDAGIYPVLKTGMMHHYFDAGHIHERMFAYMNSALDYVEASVGMKEDPKEYYMYLNGDEAQTLVKSLGNVMMEYDAHDSTRIRFVGYLLAFFLIAGLSIVFFLYFYAFKPMRRNIDDLFAIAEQKRAEAEEANMMKNDFLATISHEIRSPMSGVLGMAELLSSTPLTLEQKNYTRTILNSGETLLRIIEDILYISKIEAGKLEIENVPADMLELVETITLLYSNKARDKGIELALRYVPGTERFVYADIVRVKQVISNLVDNAIKFTRAGYVCITVRENRSADDVSADTVYYTIDVQDSGIGIPSEAQEKIFQKFTQADTSTTRLYGGTGLGLSISRQLVEIMGGELWVNSHEGQGTTFSFTLPLKRNVSEGIRHVQTLDLTGLRVLIIDDLEVIRAGLSEQLRSAGASCDMAQSGRQALAMLQAASMANIQYDIILIDYLMPDMNGEMIACAIEDMNLPATRKILITGAGNASSPEDLARRGFSGYIAKPVSSKVLLHTVARVHENAKAGNHDVVMGVDQGAPRTDELIGHGTFTGTRVLLVEDSRVNQAFVMDVLTQAGCVADIAANGQEAIDKVQEDDYDIVLMDCQMPVMDGFEAAGRIRAMKSSGVVRPELPVIALTANAMKSDRQKCLDAGMDDYLSKPVRKQDLYAKVAEWTGRAATQGEALSGASRQYAGTLIDPEGNREARSILKERYEKALEFFKEDSQAYLKDMRTAFNENDSAAMLRPAHTLKSSAASFGAIAVTELSRKLEAAAKEANGKNGEWDVKAVGDMVTNLDAVLQETIALLAKENTAYAA